MRLPSSQQVRAEIVEAQSMISRLRAELFDRDEKGKADAAEAEALKSKVRAKSTPPHPNATPTPPRRRSGADDAWLAGDLPRGQDQGSRRDVGDPSPA